MLLLKLPKFDIWQAYGPPKKDLAKFMLGSCQNPFGRVNAFGKLSK